MQGAWVQSLVKELRSHKLQWRLKIPRTVTKTQCSQINEYIYIYIYILNKWIYIYICICIKKQKRERRVDHKRFIKEVMMPNPSLILMEGKWLARDILGPQHHVIKKTNPGVMGLSLRLEYQWSGGKKGGQGLEDKVCFMLSLSFLCVSLCFLNYYYFLSGRNKDERNLSGGKT